ncbi:Uncharacterised protein [Mycolicibacterium smegmatis]|nr:Uncharacterised protein [Mycolicibacterium smegmatis]
MVNIPSKASVHHTWRGGYGYLGEAADEELQR